MQDIGKDSPRVVRIDGAQGEGGGQILRTALSLSMVTGTPFRLDNIRAARRKPGLRPQHLTAVRSAQTLSQAHVDGAKLGASTLMFQPGVVRSGNYAFDIETAGSTVLVAQTLIPALLCAKGSSHLLVEGGTHNPQSPPFEFLEGVFLPLLRRMGATIEATIERPGYFPAGGGRLEVTASSIDKLSAIELLDRGRLLSTSAEARVSNLPVSIAERELGVVGDELSWEHLHAKEETGGKGPGNVLILTLEFEGLTALFTGYGERGVRAETVARRVVREVRRYLDAGAAVGPYLADQLLLPMALAGGGCFTTLEPSTHARTNASILQQFLPIRIDMKRTSERIWTVSIERAGLA